METKLDGLDYGLISGLAITIGGWVWTAGVGWQKRCELERRVTNLEETTDRHDDRLDKHDIQYAAIDAKLDLLIQHSITDKGD